MVAGNRLLRAALGRACACLGRRRGGPWSRRDRPRRRCRVCGTHWWSPARAEDAERTISKRNGVTDMCKYGNVHISSKIRVWACTLDSLGDVERKKTGVACVIIQHHNPP